VLKDKDVAGVVVGKFANKKYHSKTRIMAETDNQAVKSKRDSFSERLRSKYPDREFADDEALFGQISDDYDDYDSQISGYQEREQKIADMFTSDPRSAHFVTTWRDGGDPVVEFVRMFGTDIKERLEDPDWQAQLAEANKDYVERVAREKELEEQYNANLDATKENLRQFQEQNGLSDEQLDEVFSVLASIVADGLMGKFSVESMELAKKAINHDVDVEEAGAEGEVRGKNARIDEKLRTRKRGDGVTALSGKNPGSGAERRGPELGALNNFGDGEDIWSRGGERRTKYNG
jgi:hypothetical protein